MTDIIVLAVVVGLVVLAVVRLVNEQKKGSKCLGCPMASTCAKKKTSCK
ncbi:MAG: FeoB-associated Cys-rich membrane protein [Erysipelotrichaceae bacterium]|nr:FeoB-associated Cys-rich membrane protein [Erysipelotrichaceae bacterium]